MLTHPCPSRIAASLFVVALLSGCGNGSGTEKADSTPATTKPTTVATTEPPTLTVHASVAVINIKQSFSDAMEDGETHDCEDASTDVYEGLKMSLNDATGNVVGVAEISPTTQDMSEFENICAWDAVFTDVPPGGKFYTAKIGGYESAPVAEEDVATQKLVIDANPD